MKDTGIRITESLTQERMQRLTKARNEFLFKNVWTQYGKVLVKLHDNTIKVSYDDASFADFLTVYGEENCVGE